MPSEVFAIWLGFEGCSKRAVQYCLLTPEQADFVAAEAAASLKPGASLIEYQTASQSMGAARMIVAFSDPLPQEPDLRTPEAIAKINWTKLIPVEMGVRYNKGEIFTAKDTSILNKMFQRYHDANQFEVEQILGKAKRVTST